MSKVGSLIKKDRPQNLPLITISREYGSWGSTIAARVAEKLKKPWRLYHQEIIDEITHASHLEKNLIKEVDESKIALIDEVIEDFFGRRHLNLSSYYKHLIKVLSTIGNRGNAVILGRGANFLFPNALRIRIICVMEQRIKNIMRYKRISEKKAIARIKENDEKRNEFAQALFHHDPRKSHHYDLVIRTGESLGVQDATNIIVALAKRRFRLK
jgi:cytidylate kinase